MKCHPGFLPPGCGGDKFFLFPKDNSQLGAVMLKAACGASTLTSQISSEKQEATECFMHVVIVENSKKKKKNFKFT